MNSNIEKSFSKSPLKPKLLLQYLKRKGIYDDYLEFEKFKPFIKVDCLIAEYVEG